MGCTMDAQAAGARFIPGDVTSVTPITSGHINSTFVVHSRNPNRARHVLQCINTHIFPAVAALTQNICTVVEHIQAQPTFARLVPALVPRLDGGGWLLHTAGSPEDGGDGGGEGGEEGGARCWRCFAFVPYTVTLEVVRSPSQAYHMASTFGLFVRALSGLDPSRLTETIPGFHNTPQRYAKFIVDIDKDCKDTWDGTDRHCFGRSSGCVPDIEFIKARCHAGLGDRNIASALQRGTIPTHVCHNDAKLSNVLLHCCTGEGVAVVDLDTCMPGTPLYDFGDMVRSSVCVCAEDEEDLRKVVFRPQVFSALWRGFLDGAGQDTVGTFSPEELRLLRHAPWTICLEQGIRFLHDALVGDVYYKVHKPRHNILRARVQLEIVRQLELHAAFIDSLV